MTMPTLDFPPFRLPPDADGHFIKLPAGLAAAAEAELSAELDRYDG